jgi:hypothetical protein
VINYWSVIEEYGRSLSLVTGISYWYQYQFFEEFNYGWQVMPKFNQSTQSRVESDVLRMASEPRELQL